MTPADFQCRSTIAKSDPEMSMQEFTHIGHGQAGAHLRDLFVAFRRELRMTPVQYVIAQRLQRSRWLLQNTTQDIGEIALATGFASHSHLTTTFKKHSGLTPSEFRLRHAG
jgi:transcriptional regulator GlxA family with amidase domain